MYEGQERRSSPHLTEEQIETIAERAATKALERVYAQIGKSVVQKFLFLVGAAIVAIAAWMKGSGKW